MEYRDTHSASKPPSGKTMKARAPPPPRAPEPAPRHVFRNAAPDGAGANENVLRTSVDVHVTLPQGRQISMTVDGSKALMDLRVELCSRYHLNPSLHALELLSPDGTPLAFKPNAPLGSLDVHRILIKEKDPREAGGPRRPAPKVPEKTVRLVVNFHRTQKAVVRVSPLAPLQDLLPAICDKCDFQPSRVLLLRDGLSRHELPLDRSLSQLGIKELYVHDQSLVLQPKMASAPALNYSDSMTSSTLSVGAAERRGFLGMFRFNSRKSKAEDSMDGDYTDVKTVHSTETPHNGFSTTGPGVSEARPSTLGQSQSAMNLSRTSPKSDAKKRKAPAPPPTPGPSLGPGSLDGYQAGPGSDSQLRKRKAPAAPPTESSDTPSLEDDSATPTRDNTPVPTPTARTKLTPPAPPAAVASAPAAPKPTAAAVAQPVRKQAATPTPSLSSSCASTSAPSSPAPSSTTGGSSLTARDSSSSSLCSQGADPESDSSMEASDGSVRRGSLGTVSAASVPGGDTPLARVQLRAQPAAAATTFTIRPRAAVGRAEESVGSGTGEAGSLSRSSQGGDRGSAVELRMDAVENNRHSAVAWLHSLPSSRLPQGEAPGRNAPEEETLSLGSSSGSSSLPDQGYAASEGMAEAEDPGGLAGSPWGTQPTSPDKTLTGGGGGGGRPLGVIRDVSSDSDEGCASLRSRHRPMDIGLKDKVGNRKNAYEDNQHLTAQLHQTLEDFDADLEDISHIETVSPKGYPYASRTDTHGVHVSVLDLVPVTAIDVPDDYENVDSVPNTLTRSSLSHGLSVGQRSGDKVRNKNNNACDDTGGSKLVSDVPKRPAYVGSAGRSWAATSTVQPQNKPENRSEIRSEKKPETGSTAREASTRTASAEEEKLKARPSENVLVKMNGKENGPHLPPKNQRTVSANGTEDVGQVPAYRPHLNTEVISAYSASVSQSKITHSSTSRFGLRTFTVVPPKPAVPNAAQASTASPVSPGAIKIDEQGNMVKTGAWQRSASVGAAPESSTGGGGGGPELVGQAKAFWSSSERRDASETPRGNAAFPETVRNTKTPEEPRNVHALRHQPFSAARQKEQDDAAAKKDVTSFGVTERQVIILEGTKAASDASALAATVPPSQRRDLSFLKPTRRTSSQYVASAISRYAKPDAAAVAPSQDTPQSGYQRGTRSAHMTPRRATQTLPAAVDPGPPRFPGHVRSASHPDFTAEEALRDGPGRVVVGSVFTRGGPTAPETERVGGWPIVTPPPVKGMSGVTKSNPVTEPDGPHRGYPTKQEVGAKMTASVVHGHSTVTVTTATDDPEASVLPAVGVGMFGPVKKFKKVTCKPVEEQPCLHNMLMDAIQTGGLDRLRKTSAAGPGGPKKAFRAEDESERSALLAAIRAPASSGMLRQTKSQAAGELEVIRRTSTEEHPVVPPSGPFLQLSSPPPPPPPPPPPAVPKAQPPRLRSGGSGAGDPQGDPASAREAMLEAIRSGSAVGNLKKISAPVKTVHVNGRLGTIRSGPQ